MAQRNSRKRRKERQRARSEAQPAAGDQPAASDNPLAPAPKGESDADRMARGYARGRIKDEEARAKLVPLGPGERPTAVTVAMWVALIAAVGNSIALLAGFDSNKGPQNNFSILVIIILFVAAAGMWKVRYWAVLGMQALLLITILIAVAGLITAGNIAALIVTLVLIAACGTLFWFLVKSMARIQMPTPPGR